MFAPLVNDILAGGSSADSDLFVAAAGADYLSCPLYAGVVQT